MNGQGSKFYGKYRGTVTSNQDKNKQGRLQVKVQDILGNEESGWAMPSVPYAGKHLGLYLIPPGSNLNTATQKSQSGPAVSGLRMRYQYHLMCLIGMHPN